MMTLWGNVDVDLNVDEEVDKMSWVRSEIKQLVNFGANKSQFLKISRLGRAVEG